MTDNDPSWTQILEAVERLEAEVRNDREAADKAEKAASAAAAKSEKRLTTNRRATRVAILVGLFGGLVGLQGYRTANAANAERAARTVTSCEQTAGAAVRDNTQDDVFLDLFTNIVAGSDDPATVEFLQPYIDEIRANRSPVRDCSPAGIDLYFQTGGEAGYLP